MARRLVVLGHKKAKHATRYERIDNNRPDVVAAAGLIPWFPETAKAVPDYDLIRKQNIEDRLAGGEGDRA